MGINLNDRFEAESIGLVSINNKPYTRSNIVGNFCDMLISRATQKKDINEDQLVENKNLHFHPFSATESQILEAGAKMSVMSAKNEKSTHDRSCRGGRGRYNAGYHKIYG